MYGEYVIQTSTLEFERNIPYFLKYSKVLTNVQYVARSKVGVTTKKLSNKLYSHHRFSCASCTMNP